jgi:hypothetical protein
MRTSQNTAETNLLVFDVGSIFDPATWVLDQLTKRTTQAKALDRTTAKVPAS